MATRTSRSRLTPRAALFSLVPLGVAARLVESGSTAYGGLALTDPSRWHPHFDELLQHGGTRTRHAFERRRRKIRV